MFRIRAAVLCLVIAFMFNIAPNVSGGTEAAVEEMLVPMGVIVLEPDPSIEQKRSPVEFNHGKHFNFECRTCHHKWDGKTKITNCTTSNCHNLLKAPKKPTKYLAYTEQGIKYYKYAYHQACIGCHKDVKVKQSKMEMALKASDKTIKKVPTSCNECHPKE